MRLPTGRAFLGIFLAALGILFLANNLGLMYMDLGTVLSLYWPVIPIYFGLAGIVEALSRRSVMGGFMWGTLIVNAFFTAVFVLVLGNNNGWWAVGLSIVWKLILPVILLSIGVSMLRGSAQSPSAKTILAVMGGPKDVRNHWDDLALVAVMGGGEVDFTGAGLPEREVLIDMYAVMGGFTVKVPQGVMVDCEWTGVMGGMEVLGQNHSGLISTERFAAGSGPRIRVRAHTVMGGCTVKALPARDGFVG